MPLSNAPYFGNQGADDPDARRMLKHLNGSEEDVPSL